MSGLDKMKAQIIAEAQDNAKEILAQAHAQADSIIGEAKAQAEKDARKIVAQAEPWNLQRQCRTEWMGDLS